MIILLRIVLVGIIIYLLVRSFNRYFFGEGKSTKKPEKKEPSSRKKISKYTGEYIDYEEIKE